MCEMCSFADAVCSVQCAVYIVKHAVCGRRREVKKSASQVTPARDNSGLGCTMYGAWYTWYTSLNSAEWHC